MSYLRLILARMTAFRKVLFVNLFTCMWEYLHKIYSFHYRLYRLSLSTREN